MFFAHGSHGTPMTFIIWVKHVKIVFEISSLCSSQERKSFRFLDQHEVQSDFMFGCLGAKNVAIILF